MSVDTFIILYNHIATLGTPFCIALCIALAGLAQYKGVWFWGRDMQRVELALEKLQFKYDQLEEKYSMAVIEKDRAWSLAQGNERLLNRSIRTTRRAVKVTT